MSLVCQIFKGTSREEMYLYVEKSKGLKDVPDVLLAQFGELSPVMTLHLKAESKLARTEAAAVLASIQDKGFFLQMPPTAAELLQRESGNV